jgi:hypothetical protein
MWVVRFVGQAKEERDTRREARRGARVFSDSWLGLYGDAGKEERAEGVCNSPRHIKSTHLRMLIEREALLA